jgi:hypothetical protein
LEIILKVKSDGLFIIRRAFGVTIRQNTGLMGRHEI